MIVTLDGPAGAGKSSTAKELAARLGFRFLDTGAMYRAVAFAADQSGHNWNDAQALVELAQRIRIEFRSESVWLDGQDVTTAIRNSSITSVTRYAADNPGVRELMVQQQRRLAGNENIVTEGRDQGTVVFPQAQCKIYLTASAVERARRRMLELQAQGEAPSFDHLLREQNERDHRDASRGVGPLTQAVDAVYVSTDGLSRDQVVDELEALVRSRLPLPRAN